MLCTTSKLRCQRSTARWQQHYTVCSLLAASLLATVQFITSSPKANAKQLVPRSVRTQLKTQCCTDKKFRVSTDVKKSLLVVRGTQLSLNGRKFAIAWSRFQKESSIRIAISDTSLMQTLGVELSNTKEPTQQPIQWFSQPTAIANYLKAIVIDSYRYLDITELAATYGWQLEIDGNTLKISTPPAQVKNIRQNAQPWGEQIIVDLDRPTPWQLRQQGREWLVTIDAVTAPSIVQPSDPGTGDTRQNNLLNPHAPNPAKSASTGYFAGVPSSPSFAVQTSQNQTAIKLNIPDSLSPRVSTTANPNRLIIEIRSDAMVERDILWAPGLRWRQQYISLGSSRFPMVWLEINLRQPGLVLKPIWSMPDSLVGIAPLLKTAPMWQASAAINGGFFNRNQQLPLGAIRRDSRWLSSPILNRGAIAWNGRDVKIGRLSLQETAIAPDGQRLPIVSLNSGYVQAGIARYTPDWGQTYTPLIDNEILVVVQNDRVAVRQPIKPIGKTPIPIPPDGYLLTVRANPVPPVLVAGVQLRIESVTAPAEFSRHPHILGAGPLLVQNGQIVLDAKAEKFSDAFIKETAARSAIAITQDSKAIVVTVHNRIGGRGPTLAEIASLMQQMGAVDALNLDGGSSTTLYLGGELINRPPSTAARVHNGLGIFLQPLNPEK